MKTVKELLLTSLGKTFKKKKSFDAVASILSKAVAENISIDQIAITNNVIYLSVKPIIKSQLFLQKDIVLKEINEVFETSPIIDIR